MGVGGRGKEGWGEYGRGYGGITDFNFYILSPISQVHSRQTPLKRWHYCKMRNDDKRCDSNKILCERNRFMVPPHMWMYNKSARTWVTLYFNPQKVSIQGRDGLNYKILENENFVFIKIKYVYQAQCKWILEVQNAKNYNGPTMIKKRMLLKWMNFTLLGQLTTGSMMIT